MTEKTFLIYKHTAPNGKAYIGLTADMEKRSKEHRSISKCTAFSKAIKKYGWDAFTHEVLAEGLTIEEANRMEICLIEKHNTLVPNGYNLRAGGGGGGLHSDETKARMSEAQKGKVHSDEARRLMALAKIGKPLADEHRAKLSAARAGKTPAQETREKIAASLRGQPMSEERRAKISQAKKNPSEATRQKLSAIRTGIGHTEETKLKMSEAQGIAWARRREAGTDKVSLEAREKMAAAKRGKKQSPELIAKRFASRKSAKEKEAAQGGLF